MNLESVKSGLWSRPLLSASRSSNDAQETSILSSIRSIEGTRINSKRAREDVSETGQHQQQHHEEDQRHKPNNALVHTSVVATATPPLLPLRPVFALRTLSLDQGAIAPGLARPTAPFAKSERKKAYVSAIYYSECFLRNIKPLEADTAAFDIQNQYLKWWVHAKKQPASCQTGISATVSTNETVSSNSSCDSEHSCKRRRLDTISAQGSLPSKLSLQASSESLLTDEQLILLKDRFIEHLQKTGGDTTTTEFHRCLNQLKAVYSFQKQNKQTKDDVTMDGTWLSLSKPAFSECQGRNEQGEYQYSLGRLSFDMFRPTHLKCSIRAVMNNVQVMDPRDKPRSFPSRLAKELQVHRRRHSKYASNEGTNNVDNVCYGTEENPIRHYDIVVAFTIEGNQTLSGKELSCNSTKDGDKNGEFVIPRPIRGLMTNHGYMVADPNNPGRCSIWFSGGSMEVQDEIEDAELWKRIFDDRSAPRRDMRAMANVLAAKFLLGAYTTTSTGDESPNRHEDDEMGGTPSPHHSDDEHEDNHAPILSYYFKRPIGGHGEVFCDTLYMDDSLRIMQGHHGSIFVFTKVPNLQETGAEDVME